MAPVVKALRANPVFSTTLLLSGQHKELAFQTLQQFGLRADADLALMQENQSLSGLTSRAIASLDTFISAYRPDIVLAQGDTTTVLAASMVCFYRSIAFGHIEAGLRTHDLANPFPEEFNRRVTAIVSTLHFAPTHGSAAALKDEGVSPDSIVITGNTSIDNLATYAEGLTAFRRPPAHGQKLVLLTCHRRESFGLPMDRTFEAIRRLLDAHPNIHVLYPVHPNPHVQSAASKHFGGASRVALVPPLDYFEFVAAMREAHFILSDSGGVQEEAPWLGKPVLVLRDETERPEAVECGVARIVGADGRRLFETADKLLRDPSYYRAMSSGASPYGDGNAAGRILQRLEDHFGLPRSGPFLAPFGSKAHDTGRGAGGQSVETAAP